MSTKLVWDAEFRQNLKEVSKIVNDYIEDVESRLPEGWNVFTWMGPIQYEKTIKIGKKFYMGYLRSRHNHPFSIGIYEKGRKFKLKKLIFEHKHVDKAENNPPLKSVMIIENQFRKMKKRSEMKK
ncbi:MAG TPA: hypothetical protein VJH04_02440 [archaeon]|nr:hypothetical protein [archaeon]